MVGKFTNFFIILDFILCNKFFYKFAVLASVAELVDALDSKSSSFESVGSIPTRSTKHTILNLFICIIFALINDN